eukprot:COSAG04_NODE_5_length_50521_cov_24.772639_35_plen_135_part_00
MWGGGGWAAHGGDEEIECGAGAGVEPVLGVLLVRHQRRLHVHDLFDPRHQRVRRLVGIQRARRHPGRSSAAGGGSQGRAGEVVSQGAPEVAVRAGEQRGPHRGALLFGGWLLWGVPLAPLRGQIRFHHLPKFGS